MDLNRREFLVLSAVAVAHGAGAGTSGAADEMVTMEVSLRFLCDLTRDVVEASRVRPGDRVGASPVNTCGFTLIRPGGRSSYPSYWIRDFAMSLESGFVTSDEMHSHLILTARCQNGATERKLASGAILPRYAIPDHINFDGKAVYFPGTYSSGEDQGGPPWGVLPPIDDHYEFCHIANQLRRVTGRVDFLREKVGELTILDRLIAAFDSPATDPASGMVITDEPWHAVGFGFCDSSYFTGAIMFPSLLRWRAAGELAEFCDTQDRRDVAERCRQVQAQIERGLIRTFAAPERLGGWLMAATRVGRQADVWGTLYALHLGVLRESAADRALDSVLDACRRGTIAYEAAVRHVPTDMDASPASAWERTNTPRDVYQNGAYWHTPTGWLIEALTRRDRSLARQVFDEYIAHLRREDFRQGPAHAGPWECFGRDGKARANPVYMTSVTLPLAVIRKLRLGP